jgi:hypothetical protein
MTGCYSVFADHCMKVTAFGIHQKDITFSQEGKIFENKGFNGSVAIFKPSETYCSLNIHGQIQVKNRPYLDLFFRYKNPKSIDDTENCLNDMSDHNLTVSRFTELHGHYFQEEFLESFTSTPLSLYKVKKVYSGDKNKFEVGIGECKKFLEFMEIDNIKNQL